MLVEGGEDDNEKWAGAKVLGVMKSLAVLDAVVVVSRWCASSSVLPGEVFHCRVLYILRLTYGTVWPNGRYGGTMLDPVRFTHIGDCTRQVCNQIIVKDEV